VIPSDPPESQLAHLDRQLKRLESAIHRLETRLAVIENSLLFRLARWVGRWLPDFRAITLRFVGKHWRDWYLRLVSLDPRVYRVWMERQDAEPLPELASKPRFHILMPIWRPGLSELQETVESVTSQTYPFWELFVCQEASPDSSVQSWLKSLPASDSRIRLVGDLTATGQANYLITLVPGDRLAPNALHWFAAAGPADLIYSDEERITPDGRGSYPVFKPDWSPDLLLSSMYLGDVIAVAREAFDRAGGFHTALHDLALRITDHGATVRHVARILYRAAPAKVANGTRPNFNDVRWVVPEGTLVSLIVCSRSHRLLSKCLDSLTRGTAYPRREVIVVQHLGGEDRALQAAIESHGAKRVPYSGPFHFSRMNNLGARKAAGEVLVFLNDDVEPLDSGWLDRLAGQVCRPDVGIAGARLLYPSGMLQHAGIVIGINEACGHAGRGFAAAPSYWPWLECTRDVSAVTGACLAIRAPLFRQLGGFDEAFPVNYNDVDLCFRVRAAGYRIIYDAGAVLQHRECQSRPAVVTWEEWQRWYDRWHEVIERGDPYYSPHLNHRLEDLALNLPVSSPRL
jgi:O-antigen biosynthesis protein